MRPASTSGGKAHVEFCTPALERIEAEPDTDDRVGVQHFRRSAWLTDVLMKQDG